MFGKLVCRFPLHWFESTTLTFMVHSSLRTANLVLLSKRNIVHKHGSDMMALSQHMCLLGSWCCILTLSHKHFYHFSNVYIYMLTITLPFINLIVNIILVWLEKPGFLSAFCPRGSKMRLYELLGGGQVLIRVQSMRKTREVRVYAPPGNFDFWPFIRHNWVKSGTVFAQT